MNIKNILFITSAALALIPSAHAYQGIQPFNVSTTLLYPNGKPAIDATVIEDYVNYYTHDITTTSFKPDSQGHVSFKANIQAEDAELVLYAISPTGMGFLNWGDQLTPATTTLHAITSVRIHLVDSSGNAVPHALVRPTGVSMPDDIYNIWDENIPGPWSSTTDNNGYATLTQLPQGASITLGVHNDQFALPHGDTTIRLSKEAVTPDVTVQLIPAGSISGTVVFGPTGKPAPGIPMLANGSPNYSHMQPVVTDKDGNFTFSGLTDDTYRIGVYRYRKNLVDWVAMAQSVPLVSAAHIKSITFTLITGAVITGKVTDIATGKPLPNIRINAGTQQDSPPQRRTTEAQTGLDGTYTLRLIPGKTTVIAYTPWDRPSMKAKAQNLNTLDGDTNTIDFQIIAPILPAAVHGTVLTPNGKPAPNAIVIGYDKDESPQVATTDPQGHFTLDTPGLEPNGKILARSGSLWTQSAITNTPRSPITLQLAATGVCTISGQINDSDGNPIANTSVLLTLCLSDRSTAVIDHTTSNAQGQYTFGPTFGNAKYAVSTRPPDHAPAISDPLQATAGQVLQFPTLVATIADAILGGTVVDYKGNPVANITVYDEVMSDSQVITDKAGHFVLTGTPRGKTNVYAMSPDGNYGFQSVTSGRGDNVIYLQKTP